MAMRLVFPCTGATGTADRINHGNALMRPPANIIFSKANANADVRGSASTRGRFSICRAVSDKDTTKEGSSVEHITKKYGLEAGLWKIFTTKDDKNGENGKEMKKNLAKQLLARYGGAYLATSISLSVVSFTVCYLLINAGVDVQGLLDKGQVVCRGRILVICGKTPINEKVPIGGQVPKENELILKCQMEVMANVAIIFI